ncbi:MAG: sugar phosphate isomerase/epimerase [Planctomycetes bacterium]|nr:sugar phosphate isomerase/epimerase [Planctomycetota bacterium]
MTLSRRNVLKLGVGAAGMWITGVDRSLAAAKTERIPIGLELWSVRHQCEKELPTVLQAVAGMGYETVELAHSYCGHDAAAWRTLLDDNGLKSCGMHMGLGALEGNEFGKTVDKHLVIGSPYLIIASLPKKGVESVEAIKKTADTFNGLAERLKGHGMKIGYHCHGGDFEKVGDLTVWELLGKHTSEDVILQLDIGNCLGGGGDPYAMLEKFPGRSLSVHLKDHGGKPGAVVGEGTVDWKKVFNLCESLGNTKHYIVEEEGREGPEALEVCRRARENLRKMGK